MLRVWGVDEALGRARRAVEAAGWPGRWLDMHALAQRAADVPEAPYGNALFLLSEGAIFAPSYLGGSVRGMHGYDLDTKSSRAAVACDRELPANVRSLADVAGLIDARLTA